MKNLIIILCVFAGIQLSANAQTLNCGTCTPQPTCYAPGGTQCPLSGQSPVMYQYQPYSTDVTFYMPADTNISGIGNVSIVNVEYVSITGLPLGISWQTNNAMNGNNYSPSNGEQLACIRFCGTPLAPAGTYTATITVNGTANIMGGISQVEHIYYDFVIAPPTSGNAYFNYVQQSSCDSTSVTYSANVNLNPPQLVEYNWNFANGNTSTVANPPVQNYNTPGVYVPQLNTIVYNTRLKSLSANAIGGWYNGDIEEPFSSTNADLQFTMNHGSTAYTSPEVANNANPSWSNLNVVLQGWTLTFTWVENDNVSANDQGGSTTVHVTGPGNYSASTTAITSGGGGVNFSFVIDKAVSNNNLTKDTFEVFASPLPPSIAANPSGIVCELTPVALSVPVGNYKYEWFKDGIMINDTIGHLFTVIDTGSYHVVITDLATGCSATSTPYQLSNYIGVYNTQIINTAGVLSIGFPQAGHTYQWVYNGLPVFPNGTGVMYTPNYQGTYFAIATNQFGCTDTSNTIVVNSLVGIEEAPLFSEVVLYPNPSTDNINLNFNAYEANEMSFTIIDAMGKQIYTESIQVPQGNYTKNFQLQGLAPGFYMVKVANGKKTQTLRFIKN